MLMGQVGYIVRRTFDRMKMNPHYKGDYRRKVQVQVHVISASVLSMPETASDLIYDRRRSLNVSVLRMQMHSNSALLWTQAFSIPVAQL
jgi:hypothetical protein